MANARRKSKVGTIVKHVLIAFFTTLLLIIIALYLLMLVIAKGPSPSAKKLFVCSVQETSAIKFLANWYFTDEEIAEYRGLNRTDTEEVMNASLIQIKSPDEPAAEGEEPRKATELIDVSGKTFKGKLLKVSDPSRVFVGVSGEFGKGQAGKRIIDMMHDYGAMAGTNAGGFADDGGVGNGGTPLGVVVSQGNRAWFSANGYYKNVVGFDENNILHVGNMSGQDIIDLGLRDAVSWELGPILVMNGKAMNEQESLGGGFNPRTAIGQAADGTVLLLVVDGRQASSIGATYDDLVSIMLQHGAVNAANLDGGSSSLMYVNDELVTVCSSLYGPRTMPTGWLVKPES